jgi:hypothetical protein
MICVVNKVCFSQAADIWFNDVQGAEWGVPALVTHYLHYRGMPSSQRGFCQLGCRSRCAFWQSPRPIMVSHAVQYVRIHRLPIMDAFDVNRACIGHYPSAPLRHLTRIGMDCPAIIFRWLPTVQLAHCSCLGTVKGGAFRLAPNPDPVHG